MEKLILIPVVIILFLLAVKPVCKLYYDHYKKELADLRRAMNDSWAGQERFYLNDIEPGFFGHIRSVKKASALVEELKKIHDKKEAKK